MPKGTLNFKQILRLRREASPSSPTGALLYRPRVTADATNFGPRVPLPNLSSRRIRAAARHLSHSPIFSVNRLDITTMF